jgi:hypothetical protein
MNIKNVVGSVFWQPSHIETLWRRPWSTSIAEAPGVGAAEISKDLPL